MFLSTELVFLKKNNQTLKTENNIFETPNVGIKK